MSSPDEPMFRAGLVLDGRYRLERPLGVGGMGTVWVGQQLALGREVAIKSIRPDRAQDQARLEREARLLASVRHPAVVQIFDFGRTPEGLGYVVMEVVSGPSLEEHIVASGRLPAEEAVGLVVQLLDGLAAVHAAGIVHRDIKPANIVLATEVRAGARHVMPKLLDFGIARNEEASMTLAGVVMGTPAYMAPEQVLGLPTDPRADLWAVGATLYDAIAGEPPFSGSSAFEVMRKVTDDPPPFPRQAIGLDGKLWSVLTASMRKDPNERPQSALVLRDRLAEWLSGRATAQPLSGPTRVMQPTPLQSSAETAPALEPIARPPSVTDLPSTSLDALIKERLRES